MNVWTWRLALGVFVLATLGGTSAAADRLEASVGIIQRETGDVLSAGEAKYFNSLDEIDWNAYITIRHRIVDTANGYMLVDRNTAAWGEYQQSVSNAPQPDRCYRGKIDAWSGGFERHEDSAETVCPVPPKPLPDGDKTGESTINPGSPIVIDLDRGGFRFTGLGNPVQFDIDGDGQLERLSWTDPSSRDPFLAIDRDGNGRIDDGRELFGNHSLLFDGETAEHGYQALAELDSNLDGYVDDGDPWFHHLLLWRDANHNGASEPEEITPLSRSEVLRLDLAYVANRRRDRYGNELRFNGRAWLVSEEGQARSTATTDVFFQVDEGPSSVQLAP